MRAHHLDLLYRYALAEHFTSPTVPATYDVHKANAALVRAGFVAYIAGRWRVTDDGRELLDHELTGERAATLRRVRERALARSARFYLK